MYNLTLASLKYFHPSQYSTIQITNRFKHIINLKYEGTYSMYCIIQIFCITIVTLFQRQRAYVHKVSKDKVPAGIHTLPTCSVPAQNLREQQKRWRRQCVDSDKAWNVK